MMLYLILGLGALFFGLGWMITPKNAHWLLNGYKDLTEEEQAAFDLQGLLSFQKRFHLFFGAIFILVGAGLLFAFGEEVAITFVGLAPILAYLYFIVETRKFWPLRKQKQLKWVIYLLTGTFVLLSLLFTYGNDPAELQWDEKGLKWNGMYGEEFPREEIASLALVDSLPTIRFKTNGYAVGNHYQGHFRTRNRQKIKLYVENKAKGPFLLLKTKGNRSIYYNEEQRDMVLLFDSLKASMPEVGF
jgi:hypothetical protein